MNDEPNQPDEPVDMIDRDDGQEVFEYLIEAGSDMGAPTVAAACISYLSLLISKGASTVAEREEAILRIGLDMRIGFDLYDKVQREGLN